MTGDGERDGDDKQNKASHAGKMHASLNDVKYFINSSEIVRGPLRLTVLQRSLQHGRTMPDQKAHEVLRKHNISLEDVKERRATLHHLRHIVHAEELPFDVFKAIVKLRR